jgi:predicted nucleic acid-binding protein
MPPSIVKMSSYTPAQGKPLLFDTNIWLPLIWPSFSCADIHASTKTSFVKKCLNSSAKILLPSVIPSELVNVILREEHKSFSSVYPQFKQFRSSTDGKRIIIDIKEAFKQLQNPRIERISDAFDQSDFASILQELENIDFNDNILINIGLNTDSYIVSNDRDLRKTRKNITIIIP